MNLYKTNMLGYYTGESIEIDDGAAIPVGFILSEDVPLNTGFSRWNGSAWIQASLNVDEALEYHFANQPQPPPVVDPELVPSHTGPTFLVTSWDDVRNFRNRLLTHSDWTQSRDVELTNNAEWVTYRQTLRDLPSRFDSYQTVEWPTAPSSE